MTVKKRLFWSNILMILVPVIMTVLIGLLCVAVIWMTLLRGARLDQRDQEDFEHICMAITEVIEYKLDQENDFEQLYAMLDQNGMALKILENGASFFSYGEITADDDALAALSALLILATILLSIFLTNRFLTRFVFRKIEEPLNILTNGVHEIRDGNLDYRLSYQRNDEFRPVCEAFNEMAARLKQSVLLTQQQEKSRKELLAGISHDIRSPLTSIQAYVEGLLDGIAKTPAAQRKYLETIKVKAENLAKIVSQLFLFSKMELGECPGNPCSLQLDRMITDIVSGLKEEYLQNGLEIELELEPAVIYADPVQFHRIVVNILENSLKYKDKRQGRVRILLKRNGQGCSLLFSDNGPGVPEEALSHLFEVFYRSDPARRNPDQGSGLGLAIVANAVRQIGGTIQACPSALGGLEIRIEFEKVAKSYGEDTDYRR